MAGATELGDSFKNNFVLLVVMRRNWGVIDVCVHLSPDPQKEVENTEQPNSDFPGQGSNTSKP